ncbi:MAG: SpaA isopeptide-forming pilin-related protein, partial [Oscillospiraceae bacterium]|nr:SpaA isopeptide-forming pilin-related protein [Oscillospiraceae bacterium]
GEAGSYSVTLSDSITDPKIYGIVLAGYPYKTIDELGVGNDWDAELATKLALRAYLNGWNINNFSVYGSDTSGEYAEVLAAIKNIYNAGIQNTVIPPAPSVTVTATGGNTMTASGDNLVKEYTVTSNVTIKSYTVTLPSNAPTGTKITASDGVTEKTTFNSGEKFMLTIPTSSVTSSSSLTLDVTGEVANQVVLYGTSDNSSYQDYAVTSSPLTFKDANAYATYDVTTTDTTETPTEPTTQPDTSAPPTTTEIIPPDTTTPPPSPSTLEIIKLDAGTNNPLSGTVFEIKNKAGSIVYTGSTDGSGKISLSLDAGYYSITEITPPQGYALDPNSHKDNILLREGETTTVTFTDKKLSSLDITKVDADTGALLPNATIRVAKDGSTDSWDLVTNALGVAVFKDIPDGTYIVTEIVAPAGYILNSTPQTIVLQAGKIAAITLKNNAKPGIVIKKYDENTGLTLAGAEFSIAKMDGQIVYEGITDETGIIRVDNLDAGWYNITEIAAPAGYLKAAESKQVYLEAGKSVEVKFDNRLRPALKIIKVDSQTNQPLAGAKFKVQKTESATVSDYVTDANGEIIIQDLDEAVYSIWEVEAPDGYLCNSEHKDISLEWGTTKQLIFTDTAKPKLEIKKIDEATGKPLANAKFRVTATESKTVSEYVTDNTGTILIPNLNEEIYSVEEIVAPSGYLLETQHKDISLEAGTTKTLVFTDKACPKLEAQKIDSITKLPIAGAKFRVTKTDDLTVSEYTTDDTGKILIDNLEQSTYTVQEITAPDGYIGDNQVKNIQLEWGKTSTLIFENIRKPTLIFTKLDGLTYLPVPNTTYKVEYEDNNGGLVNLGTYRTDSNGQIILPQVNAGWYVITETIPAPGYTLASNPVTRIYLAPGENAYTNFAATSGEVGDISGANIMALSGSDYSATGQETINYPLNSIVIRKVNAVTGELLAGAAFEVRQVSGDISGNSGTIIGRYTTDNSGVIVITGLQPGAYIVAEVQAPANYMLSENSQQQAWLKSDGTSIVEVTFANIPYGSILVTKVDALTGKPLANARFRVTDGSGAVAGNTNGEFITDENGEFLVSNLKPGSYVVTEVEAPANYA